MAVAHLSPGHNDGVVCEACRMRHLKLLSFVFAPASPAQPAHQQGRFHLPQQAARQPQVSLQSETVSVREALNNPAPGCVCGGRHSVFFSRIYEPLLHSTLFSSHLSLMEMIVLVMVPAMQKQVKSTATMFRSEAPFPFDASGAQR